MADLLDDEEPEVVEEDLFVLNILDEESPFDKLTLDLLQGYVQAFFGIPFRVVQTPKTPVSPPGALALAEKTNRPLKCRNPRLEKHKCKSLRISHLVECLREQKESGGGIGPFPAAVGVLGITSGELFEDDTELLPWDPAPEERVCKYGIYRPELNISVLSLAHLTPDHYQAHTCNLKRPASDELRGNDQPKQHRYRVYVRNLIKTVTHYLCKLMGYEGCQNQRCLLYARNFRNSFDPYFYHLFFCAECDIKFCESMNKKRRDFIRWYRPESLENDPLNSPDAKSVSAKTLSSPGPAADGILLDHFYFAEKRYYEIQKALTKCNKHLIGLQYKYRLHQEFERELEWLHYALKVFTAKNQERHDFLAKNGVYKVKRRSLERLLLAVHEETPTLEVLHRTLEEPYLKYRCLADMLDRGPFQAPVPLENEGYAAIYFNRRHSTGGTYLEVAGALKPKVVGCFPKVGVNAQISKNSKPLPSNKWAPKLTAQWREQSAP